MLFKNYNKSFVFLRKIFFCITYINRNLSLLEQKIIKGIRNLFPLKKEIKGIKDKVLRNIKNSFEYEK